MVKQNEKSYLVKSEREVLLGEVSYGAEVPLGEAEAGGEVQLGEAEGELHWA